MYKTFSIVILAIIFILTGAATGMAAWQLNLDISTPDPNSDTGIASNKLSIGTDPAATAGYDNQLDTVALLRGPVQAYFPHSEDPEGEQKLWRDFRPDSIPQEWKIEIQSEINKVININWEANTPDNLNFTLVDQDSNQEIAMTSSTEYSYSNSTTMLKRFLIKVAENIDTIPSTGNQSGTSKGGGCGYMRNAGQKGDSMQDHGQIAINLIILLTPLLLALKYHVRKYAFVVVKRQYYRR